MKLFGIFNIFNSEISLIGGYFNLIKDNKVIQIKIDFKDEKFIFYENIGKNIKNSIYLIDLFVQTNIGIQDNPYSVCVVQGFLNSVINTYLKNISMNSKTSNINYLPHFSFIHNQIEFNINSKFVISIFDILWAYILAIYQRRINSYEKRV